MNKREKEIRLLEIEMEDHKSANEFIGVIIIPLFAISLGLYLGRESIKYYGVILKGMVIILFFLMLVIIYHFLRYNKKIEILKKKILKIFKKRIKNFSN